MDPEQIRSSCQNFAKYDKNHSGHLDKQEFRQFLSECWSEPVHKYLFEIIDTDHSGSISLSEFMAWGKATWDIQRTGDQTQWLKIVFNSCDIGAKGYLNKKEFLKFLKYNNITPGFFKESATFKRLDSDGSGTIEFEECLAIIQA
jgi:Ca2+-binding EF-hand superfamily protein